MKNNFSLVLVLVFVNFFSVFGQSISDGLNYSSNSYQGTARYNSMSGAFGALGGDLSAIAVNPAGSAVFNNGYFSIKVLVTFISLATNPLFFQIAFGSNKNLFIIN